MKILSPLFVLVLGAVWMSLSGCSGSSGGSDGGHVTIFEYDPAMCTTLMPTTGNQAIHDYVSLKKPVESAYFGKRYNRYMLEAVLGASGVETQKFIAESGINVSKIPYNSSKPACLFQHDLPTPAKFLADHWAKVAARDHGGGYLDGLFVKYTHGSDQTEHEAIMVRENSSRWTLVHEMMHANFFRQRRDDNEPDDQELADLIDANRDQMRRDIANYNNSLSVLDYNRVVADYDQRTQLLYKALVTGPLEEVANESLLLEEWLANRLMNVPDSAARNAAWYINYSKNLSLTDLTNFNSEILRERDAILANPPHAQEGTVAPPTADEIRASFQKSVDFIADLNKKTNELAENAKNRTKFLGPIPDSMITSGLAISASIAPDELPIAEIQQLNNTLALKAFRH